MKQIELITRHGYIVAPSKQFSGLLSKQPVTPGNIIEIYGQHYCVEQLKKIDCTLFVIPNKLVLKHNFVTYNDSAKVLKFLNSVGFTSVKDFTRSFFQQPTYDGCRAKISVWYIAFNKNQYF